MARSCPETRERILTGVKLTKGPISGTIPEIKEELGCADITDGKFVRALNSLRYGRGLLTWRRRWSIDGIGIRELHDVTLTSKGAM